jgi:23S rRNA (guanosine2251-2'-O)-methyltransferase
MKKPKRTEPRRTEPWRGGGTQHSGYKPQPPRGKSGSRYAPPPKLNPVYQDPKTAGPPKDDPRYSGPRKLNPVYQDPKDTPPNRPDPRGGHPNRIHPRNPESRFQDPRRSGPRKPDDRHGRPDRPHRSDRPDQRGPRKPEFRQQDQRRPDQRFPRPERVEPPAPPAVPAAAPASAAPPDLGPNMIAGRNPVMEALRSGTTNIEKVIFLAGLKGESLEKIRGLAKKRGILTTDMGKQKFRELTQDAITQGVVAIVGIKEYVDIVDILAVAQKKNEPPCILILDEIEDPHNLGALIRTAECAGIHGVVIPKHHAASVTQTVAKTSAGASEHMPVAKVVNIAQTIDALKKEGIWIVGTDDSAEQAFTKVDFTLPVAIVIGNEGKGVRQLVREKCDFLVKIPLYGKIGSLNASVAGALIMYEMVRKRKAL